MSTFLLLLIFRAKSPPRLAQMSKHSTDGLRKKREEQKPQKKARKKERKRKKEREREREKKRKKEKKSRMSMYDAKYQRSVTVGANCYGCRNEKSLKIPSLHSIQISQRLPLSKRRVGQNIALHASLVDRKRKEKKEDILLSVLPTYSPPTPPPTPKKRKKKVIVQNKVVCVRRTES